MVIFPDHGMGYLSKLYSEEWLLEKGFIEESDTSLSLVKKSSANI
ncbi:MAG: hypothetical protein U5L96_17025 [Owenweeksia sp.]|nr:hypothetical protein [Owenweeksia sp.]